MKITLLKHEKHNGQHDLELLFERESGAYNNALIQKTFLDSEVEGLSDNEIRTKAIITERQTVINCFNRIEPCDEIEKAIGFEQAPSRPVTLTISAPYSVMVGDTINATAYAVDQYGGTMTPMIPVENNNTVAQTVGDVVLTARLDNLVDSKTVKVLEA